MSVSVKTPQKTPPDPCKLFLKTIEFCGNMYRAVAPRLGWDDQIDCWINLKGCDNYHDLETSAV